VYPFFEGGGVCVGSGGLETSPLYPASRPAKCELKGLKPKFEAVRLVSLRSYYEGEERMGKERRGKKKEIVNTCFGDFRRWRGRGSSV